MRQQRSEISSPLKQFSLKRLNLKQLSLKQEYEAACRQHYFLISFLITYWSLCCVHIVLCFICFAKVLISHDTRKSVQGLQSNVFRYHTQW